MRVHAIQVDVVCKPWSLPCGDCISVCPENIIETGEGGFPELSFRQDGCSFCGDCVAKCKQPLFFSSSNSTPGSHNDRSNAWQHVAVIDEHCLTSQAVFCQNCKDACDVQAIEFRYGARGIPVPTIQTQACTGCGACVSPCPTSSIQMITPKLVINKKTKSKKNQTTSIEVTHEYGNSYQ